ncbi:lactate dehydrogenase [Ureibacillus massiliensis 4400831 = CIP 108448 = CCUG 49529]|uniref:Lactate dehydrogenase n=1 Tax=Ureibacillus massiliensis 4400831 = CIP 108448 = CCUG 49529 TaxID=1211035 RepID=A0A0A3JT23_9BACL|nr:DNA methyltransferase [Ureibacillus massiliensis]KGR90172.1 lactate dehydrogenase [Ureibacillus massiliensis 4400831 = CIP 108448 = CCUG 49529]
MQIEMQHVEVLIPYTKNARHNEKAVDKVASSIQEFGFKNPIIVDEHNEIIAGHTRLLAAKKLGITEVPTIKVDDLTPEQIKAFRIADNKTAEIAEWDYELLAQELEELKLADYNLELTGFDFSEAEELLDSLKDENDHAEADDFEIELPENPISQKGDVWLLGKHRLVCGDSTKVDDVTILMDGEKASMVFTDPPWNVNYGAIKEGNPQGYKPRTIKNDFMPTEDFKEFMNQAFQVMNQFSKEGCMTYVVMSAQEWGNLMLTLTENGYHWSSTIIWNKDSIVLSRKDYHTKYEPIWYGWKEGQARLHPLKDRKQGDVWDIPRPKVSELHPTMKPIQLVVQAIKNSSNMNDIVLDLFGGSGSTLIACQETDRVCRTMELDEKYADVIVNRYIDYVGGNGDVYLIRDGKKIAYSELTTLQ